ncbi:hypothetical protein Taro_042431 [Colocasia esculenta]|uniref:Uncharacterized protein n=1 Tax=Colocasia esculenta TaxID=4460 RepID=A0A843WPL0_COLES|nr:hypothetical protein [Colocasia esculenta]
MYKIYLAKFQQKYKKVQEPGAFPEPNFSKSTRAWGIPRGKLVQLRKEATLLEALAQHRCDAAPNWKTGLWPKHPRVRHWKRTSRGPVSTTGVSTPN